MIKSIFKLFIRLNLVRLLFPFYRKAIKRMRPDSSLTDYNKSDKGNKKVILALNYELFRGDLELLAEQEDLIILIIDPNFQNVAHETFYKELNMSAEVFFTERPDIVHARKKVNIFYRKLLPLLYGDLAVDCIISPNDRLKQDISWGIATENVGYPYVVLFREGLIMTDYVKDVVSNRLRLQNDFKGTHIIVQNEISKKIYVESGFIDESKVSICGVQRMDYLVEKIKTHKPTNKKRKKVVFFHFDPQRGIRGQEGRWFYNDVVLAFIELAQENPDVDFVMRPKVWARGDFEGKPEFDKLMSDRQIDLSSISNFSINSMGNLHDLILDCDVVCGGMTTQALLEACVAGKPVIVPCFDKYKEHDDFYLFAYHDHLEMFDIPENKEKYKQLINYRLMNPKIDENIQQLREDLFEEYVSPLSGNAREKYAIELRNIIEKYYSGKM